MCSVEVVGGQDGVVNSGQRERGGEAEEAHGTHSITTPKITLQFITLYIQSNKICQTFSQKHLFRI